MEALPQNKIHNMPQQEHFPLVNRLHTDVLEERYGPISAKIMRHDSELREVQLVDQSGISRTYALTFFPEQRSEEIVIIDEEIKAGEPIGKAFRAHGYGIRKNVIDVFTLEVPEWLQQEFAIQEGHAKARLSEFYARKESEHPIIYGTVMETYTPDFRGPVINTVDLKQVSALTEALETVGFTREEIWKRIGQDNKWEDAQELLEKARQLSLTKLFALKKRIREYINHE